MLFTVLPFIAMNSQLPQLLTWDLVMKFMVKSLWPVALDLEIVGHLLIGRSVVNSSAPLAYI